MHAQYSKHNSNKTKKENQKLEVNTKTTQIEFSQLPTKRSYRSCDNSVWKTVPNIDNSVRKIVFGDVNGAMPFCI